MFEVQYSEDTFQCQYLVLRLWYFMIKMVIFKILCNIKTVCITEGKYFHTLTSTQKGYFLTIVKAKCSQFSITIPNCPPLLAAHALTTLEGAGGLGTDPRSHGPTIRGLRTRAGAAAAVRVGAVPSPYTSHLNISPPWLV